MPRATTKSELIKTADEQFDKLWKTIDVLSEAEQAANFCFDEDSLTQKDGAAHWKRDKNLRDVLVHLYEWHRLLIEWESANAGGTFKPFLPAPYNWKSYGEMNVKLWGKHQKLDTKLSESMTMLKDGHKMVVAIIEKYTDAELFTKAHYKWTGTSSFGQYCISATASHYDWAIKKLKEQVKELKEK